MMTVWKNIKRKNEIKQWKHLGNIGGDAEG